MMNDAKNDSGYPHALRHELHKVLDAAGVSYWMADGLTFWNCKDGRECVGYGFNASDGTPRLAVKIVGITDPEQAIAATVGRSCASCPEADNPDSYIRHLQSALKWHDEHVPRPTNPKATCVVLQGERQPEEVLFVREDGEATHYLPERTCKDLGGIGADDEVVFNCSECGCVLSVFDKDGKNNLCTDFIYDYPRFCPACGRKVIESKEESE